MARILQIWLFFAVLTVASVAQTITPTNSSQTQHDGYPIQLSEVQGDNIKPLFSLTSLTSKAWNGIPPSGLTGRLSLIGADSATPSPDPELQSNKIALISCDHYPGYIQPIDVLTAATGYKVAAVVFYSEYSDSCALDGYEWSYPWIYTMQASSRVDDLSATVRAVGHAQGVVGFTSQVRAAAHGRTTSSGHGGKDSSNIPSTAVAMVILYSITGIVTLLFLIIIITGALRAHRHPERYGPRNLTGRQRQSRAKGLARAMLETLPIVKFGEREEAKPTDVEMADGANPRSSEVAGQEAPATNTAAMKENKNDHGEAAHIDRPRAPAEGPLVAVQSHDETAFPKITPDDNQGCSICTDDFEAGQDQRVLPCDHRFHPECIDPWLLNVSGTCPLCRIDLRPAGSRASQDGGERDENGNVLLREGNFDPPPLDPEEDPQRRSRLFFDILGIRRPDRLTREERVLALRQIRRERLATRRQRESQASTVPESAATTTATTAPESPEEERRTRRRMRDLLGIRTRRMGQSDAADETVDGQERDGAATR